MSDQQRWAWWTLAIVALTATAYVAFIELISSGPASISVFALLALTALPKTSRRYLKGRKFDERERLIAEKALLAGFRAFWVIMIGGFLVLGFRNGWEGQLTIQFWALSGLIWGAAIVVMGTEAVATLLLCRRELHG